MQVLHVQKKEVFDVYIVRRVYLLYVVGDPLQVPVPVSLVKKTQSGGVFVCCGLFGEV